MEGRATEWRGGFNKPKACVPQPEVLTKGCHCERSVAIQVNKKVVWRNARHIDTPGSSRSLALAQDDIPPPAAPHSPILGENNPLPVFDRTPPRGEFALRSCGL